MFLGVLKFSCFFCAFRVWGSAFRVLGLGLRI